MGDSLTQNMEKFHSDTQILATKILPYKILHMLQSFWVKPSLNIVIKSTLSYSNFLWSILYSLNKNLPCRLPHSINGPPHSLSHFAYVIFYGTQHVLSPTSKRNEENIKKFQSKKTCSRAKPYPLNVPPHLQFLIKAGLKL